MDDTFMGHDEAANAMLYTGVTSTCQDLARFGALMLAEGRWAERGPAAFGPGDTARVLTGGPLEGVMTGPGSVQRL